MTKTSFWRRSAFIFSSSAVDLYCLIHWAFELCVFKYSNAGLFPAPRSTPESHHNGLILQWDGSLLARDCVTVRLCFLLLSVIWCFSSLYLQAQMKASFWAPDGAWKQRLKMDAKAKLRGSNRDRNWNQCLVCLSTVWFEVKDDWSVSLFPLRCFLFVFISSFHFRWEQMDFKGLSLVMNGSTKEPP